MIDTRTWKEFRIGDLFRIEPTKGKNQQELIEGDDVPYIAASKENNGFNRMVSVEGHEDWVSKGNCLQFVHIGDAAAGHVNYIPNDFIGMNGKSSCAYNDNLNEYNGLFIASIIVHTNNGKYSFKDSWTGSKVPDTIIKLPATSDGQPDWDYMESYMKAVMEESEKRWKNLKRADDTKHLIDVSGWGEMCIGDYFEVEYGTFRPKDKLGFGEYDYITTSGFNNGITDKIDVADHQGGCITVASDGALMGSAFYQEEPFSTSNIVSTLTPFETTPLNKYNAQFICALIFSKRSEFGWLGFKFSVDRVRNLIIKVPITSTGEPDWQYMENYMRNIMDKSEKAVEDLRKAA